MFLSLFLSSYLILLVNAVQYAPEVTIESGAIRGLVFNLTTGHVVRKYLGIPFAKAERFKAPTNADKWSGVKDMLSFGKECPQRQGLFGGIEISEDCLNLNVFVPDVSYSSLLPVMVWVHGGAYVIGSNRLYDGSFISTLGDVIVVAINYRVAALGFLTTGESGDLKGNYGMLDQVQALKWVNQNIERFGGDPNKVTIFGESAGGASVSLLMLSPLTKGLYRNVIIQSGAALAKWAAASYNRAESITRSFGERIGCTDMKAMEECLKTKSLKQITDLVDNDFSFLPVIDGHFLPDAPIVLLQRGQFEKCNVMIGVTDDEGILMTNAVKGLDNMIDVKNGIQRNDFTAAITGERTKIAFSQKPPLPSAIIYRYTDWTNESDPYRNRRMYVDMMSDAMFTAPAILSAKSFVNHSLTTYFYEWQYRPAYMVFGSGQFPSWMRAPHGVDISYVFGFLFNSNASLLKTKDANFSCYIITLWTNFAKTGKPNQPKNVSISWPQYDLKNQQYIALKPTMTIANKLRAEYMAFWNYFVPETLRTLPTPEPCGACYKNTAGFLVVSLVFAASLGLRYW